MHAEEAYVEVYGRAKGRTLKDGVAMLISDGAIGQRVKEIQEQAASSLIDKSVTNREWLLEKLRVVIEGALEGEKPQYAAAVRAIELAARMPHLRLFPTQEKSTNNPYKELLEKLGDDAAVIARAKQLGLIKEVDITPPTPEVEAEFDASEGAMQ
jgi:pyruvate kinase